MVRNFYQPGEPIENIPTWSARIYRRCVTFSSLIGNINVQKKFGFSNHGTTSRRRCQVKLYMSGAPEKFDKMFYVSGR